MHAAVSKNEEVGDVATSWRRNFQFVTLPTGVRTIIIHDYELLVTKIADEFDRLPWLAGPGVAPKPSRALPYAAFAFAWLIAVATLSFWAGELSTRLF